jgi:hypothetical protein
MTHTLKIRVPWHDRFTEQAYWLSPGTSAMPRSHPDHPTMLACGAKVEQKGDEAELTIEFKKPGWPK